jgi:hypothetical protein
VLDKDGIFAAVRMAELIAFLDTKQMTLKDKLNDIYSTLVFKKLFFIQTKKTTTEN